MSNIDDILDFVSDEWKSHSTDRSYNRRKDIRNDDDFALDMKKVHTTESYAIGVFYKMLRMYSPYKIIQCEKNISDKVYESNSYRDDGDFSLSLNVNGSPLIIKCDMKAVPKYNKDGKPLNNHKIFRINMDSHNSMTKKKHYGIAMIGTGWGNERINVFTYLDLFHIESSFNTSNGPQVITRGEKSYYFLDEGNEIFIEPWFSTNPANHTDDKIESFKRMVDILIK